MVLSDRSDGKTTEMAVDALRTFLDTGLVPVFCRRYSTEFGGDFDATFIDNIYNHPAGRAMADGHELKIIGSIKRGTKCLTFDGQKCIQFDALSMVMNHKSSYGVNINRNLYIDEYIRLDNKYVSNEITVILETYETIDRKNYINKIIIAGNKITQFNPVFAFFNIKNPPRGFSHYQGGQLCVFIYHNAGNGDIQQSTPFADLVRGTSYADYMDGDFMVNLDYLIQPKHNKTPLMNVAHNGKRYSIFANGNEIVIDKYVNNNCLTVCVAPADDAVFLDEADGARNWLAKYKNYNRIKYADNNILDALTDFYKKIR